LTSRRPLGCGIALGLLSLAPGVALLAAGVWVHAHGGGWAVFGGGLAALALGLFVLLSLGAVLRRSAGGPGRPPSDPPQVS
jgi:hypothetical protein